jgi:hypothetical protein
VSRHSLTRRILGSAAVATLILGAGLAPALAQQDYGAGPTAPGAQPQRPAPQRQAPAPQQGGDFGGRDYRGAPQPQAAPAPAGPRGGVAGQPQFRPDQGPRGGDRGYGGGRGGGGYDDRYDNRYDPRFGRRDYDDFDRPRGPRGYGYGPPRVENFGRICVTSRGECRTRPGPVGANCGCEIPGFGFKRGAIGY